MDKPHFIRGLLEEVGTAIDPIQLVKRIPEGLEIEGLRDGIGRMVREYEIQHSISEGVARVLRGEVATGMDTLRAGQKRGVKFEVIPCDDDDIAAFANEKLPPGAFEGKEVEVRTKGVDPPTAAAFNDGNPNPTIPIESRANIQPDPITVPTADDEEAPPGHCTGCKQPFVLPTESDLNPTSDSGPVPSSRDTLVGFACGHVFHLSCLLPKTSASASVAASLQKQLAVDAEGDSSWRRSVGAKVAHAHVIKRAIGRGCVVCRSREVAGDGD